MKLGAVLIRMGFVSEGQVERALERQALSGKRLGEELVDEGLLTAAQLARALASQLGLPYFSLSRYYPMFEAVRLVPRAVAKRRSVIPLSLTEDGALLLDMADPLDLPARDEIRTLTGRKLRLGVSSREDIEKNLDRIYNLQDNLEGAIVEAERDREMAAPVSGGEDAPLIALVNSFIQRAVHEGAWDIHVEPCEDLSRVRIRIDGQLSTAFEYPPELHPSLTSRIKIMGGMDIAERRRPQDGRILITVDGRHIDLRVSVLPTTNGEKVVLRILDQGHSLVGLENLGLEADDREKIEAFCALPWGIVLATGPTGSGKSTTLYSMLQRINRPNVNIVTVEDPVEFSIAGVNQVQVNERAGVTFESALRSILRQDPDKVMVGEIRDQETAQIAIRAALTGHLVLSTLHTNDAAGAADRLVNMGVPPFLVAAALYGVIAQRLVRRLCPHCREEYGLDSRTCALLGVPEGTRVFRARGCDLCRNGYRGRMGVYEILAVDDEIRQGILAGISSLELRQTAIGRGMKTLRRSGIHAALAGLTSLEEVMTVSL